MPRKTTKSLERKVSPDRKYQSILVQRLINKSMLDGKKQVAERAVYTAIENGVRDLSDTGYTTFGEGRKVAETSDVDVGDDNTITIHDAKKLMAQELKAANEIGVDDKDDVSANFRKSGSDIANELQLSDGDTVTIKKADKNGEDIETKYEIKADLKDAVGTSFNSIIAAANNDGAGAANFASL